MGAAPAKDKPLITANMVTFARLIPMPALCWLIYQGDTRSVWIALILGTIIGSTDFVDGYLARKHGPTVLGGLMDPIADKVFIAFAYLPFADLGLIPAWAVALMFVREFVVTALRSAYEQRGMSMKTSYLGKVKTWTQMQGLGTILLFVLLSRETMYWIIGFGIVAPLLAMAGLWLARRKLWKGALIMSASSVVLLVVHGQNDLQLMLAVIMYTIVGITWLSGFDYLFGGLSQLRRAGDFAKADAVRLLGAFAVPCLLFAALIETPAAAWPLVTILTAELAVGGLDNLLSHHRAAAGWLGWGSRVIGVSALLTLALVIGGDVARYAAIAAAALSAIGVAIEFWRGRDYYLDARLRDKALGEHAAA